MSGDRRYEEILATQEQEGPVTNMDEALTRVINEGFAQGRSEGIAQGRSEGIAQGRSEGIAQGQIKILVSLCRSGNISVEIAADQLKTSTDEFRKYLNDSTDI